MKKKDTRLPALIRFASAITILNIFGHTILGFETSFAHPLVAILTAYSLEIGFEKLQSILQKRKPAYLGGVKNFVLFLLPSHISAMAVSMLMFTNQNLLPVIFATALAILSKVIFKVTINGRVRHFLNPSNTGLAVSFLIFPWVSTAPPYQFTENVSGVWEMILPMIFISVGGFLNYKLTKKAPLILAWLAGFFLQAIVRSLVFDTPFIPALLPMTGVAFLLYTFYMISDPSTTPMKKENQIMFGFGVAVVYGMLTALNIVFGLFFSLITVCISRGAFFYIKELVMKYRNRTSAVTFNTLAEPVPVQNVFYTEQTVQPKILQNHEPFSRL